MKSSDEKQSGQILLLIILISTVLLTVGLSLSQISIQEQKVAKLEEEKKKAFAAAEAGLDAAIKLAPGERLDITSLGLADISSGQAIVSSSHSNKFTTSSLAKDEQYTFYMAEYTEGIPPSFTSYFTGDLTFYLGSDNSCPVLELTLISDANAATRRLIDPCTKIANDIPTTSGSFSFDGTNYSYKTSFALNVTNTKLIFIRTLFESTKVGIDSASSDLPLQGKTIVSDATTNTGSSEKIELFQSYPQIPANFYVTSF